MRTYVLRYDEGEPETVLAETPSAAVAARANPALPIALTDMTAVATMRGQHAIRSPLLDRMYGPAQVVNAWDQDWEDWAR
jgi:hypothetical protein